MLYQHMVSLAFLVVFWDMRKRGEGHVAPYPLFPGYSLLPCLMYLLHAGCPAHPGLGVRLSFLALALRAAWS